MKKTVTRIEVEVEYSSENRIVKTISRRVSVDGEPEYSDVMTPELYRCDSSPIGKFIKWLISHEKPKGISQ